MGRGVTFRLRDGSGAITLKYLVEDIDRHGNVRLYIRRNGKKIRLRETPGTGAFKQEYDDALAGLAAPQPTDGDKSATLKWLIARYYDSAEFKGLAERTRLRRRRMLDRLCADRFDKEPTHGEKRYRMMEPKHVRRIRDEKANVPEMANDFVKALRQVFAWSMQAGFMNTNPARDVPYIRTASGGYHAWSIEEVRRFEERHPLGTKARLAFALLLYTGVRRSDVVTLGRQMDRDGWLHFTEAKGRNRKIKSRALPILPELRQAIDAVPSGQLTYLVTAFDKPFTRSGFGNWFKARCREAGLPHCSAHGLRKAGATIAADNGATEHQLMAIYGWESPQQAALYTRKANRKKLAGDAMRLIVPEQKTDESVPLLDKNSG